LGTAGVTLFNAPFDLSRIAVAAEPSRERSYVPEGQQLPQWDGYYGGFTFTLLTDDEGDETGFTPRIRTKTIDNKRALKGYTRTEPGRRDRFRGHFLDLRTAVFALTGSDHNLLSAGEAFGASVLKSTADGHGRITTEYVAYALNDTRATAALLEKVLQEFQRHPIDLMPTRAFSPASIAKAYLQAMRIPPLMDRCHQLPQWVHAAAMEAFYGGRAECRIRKVPLPVALVDFTSMYATVDTLMGLFDLLTAEELHADTDATAEVQTLLDGITDEECFNPSVWRDFVGLVQFVPQGHLVPVRTDYQPHITGEQQNEESTAVASFGIGINPLTTTQPLWYTIPDAIATTLNTGKAPKILRAIRFRPASTRKLANLRPVALRGEVPINPDNEDFFARVVEQRQVVKARTDGHDNTCSCDDCSTAAFLKVLANAGSYGIFAEIIRHEVPRTRGETVTIHLPDATSHKVTPTAVEEPGRYCFPAVAACLTGGARLMLTLLERQVTAVGGSYVFCDTDSLAIVATPAGGLINCPGGPNRTRDDQDAVLAMSAEQVTTIRQQFETLNPYADGALADGLLKLESTGQCLAISAKRYTMFDLDPNAPLGFRIDPDKHSKHGLGHLLNPTNPTSEDRSWIRQLWEVLVAEALNLPVPRLDWLDRPAIGRFTLSAADQLAVFRDYNHHRPYPAQVKPYNFLITAIPTHFATSKRVRLIAPYETNPAKWLDLQWRNLHDPASSTAHITTPVPAPTGQTPDGAIAVKTYRTVLGDYRTRLEAKSLAPDGALCQPGTMGLLRRRTVTAGEKVVRIGKEADRIDLMEADLLDADEAVTVYEAAAITRLQDALVLLDTLSSRQIARLVDKDRRTIDRARRGALPRADLLSRLISLAQARQSQSTVTKTTR